jgi:hypothetical protein
VIGSSVDGIRAASIAAPTSNTIIYPSQNAAGWLHYHLEQCFPSQPPPLGGVKDQLDKKHVRQGRADDSPHGLSQR